MGGATGEEEADGQCRENREQLFHRALLVKGNVFVFSENMGNIYFLKGIIIL